MRQPFQTEDKVFSLKQSERNAGRFGDRTASGVYYSGVLKHSSKCLGFTATSSGAIDGRGSPKRTK